MPVTHSDIQLYANGVELGDARTGAGAGTVFVKKNNNIHFLQGRAHTSPRFLPCVTALKCCGTNTAAHDCVD